MKFLLVTFLCIDLSYASFAQVSVEGVVTDSRDSEGVPMAQVVLLSEGDSAKVFSTLSDFGGRWSFSAVPEGVYALSIEASGYEILRDSLVLAADVPQVSRRDELVLEARSLEGVTVTAGRVRQEADKRIITFSAKQLAAVYNSMELLKSLPGIKTNVETGGVSSLSGGEVLIPVYQINGAYRSKTEPANHLFTSYKWMNWEFSATALWVGKACHYRTRSIQGMVVECNSDTWIYNNKNMIVLGVA